MNSVLKRAAASNAVTLLLVLIALPQLLFAFPGDARHMIFEHLDQQDGLSQNTVLDVMQDRVGFMWFATESGLNRFDGYTVHRYLSKRSSPTSLSNDFVWRVIEDGQGDLWLATEGGGLVQWRRDSDSFVAHRHVSGNPTSLSSDQVRTALIDNAGFIWVGTREQGLNRLDPGTGRATRYRHDSDDETSIDSNAIYTLFEDRSNQLWIGTSNGLNRYDPQTDRFVRYSFDSSNTRSDTERSIIAITQDHNGSLWFGTFGGGVSQFDPAKGTIRRFLHDENDPATLSNNTVRTLFVDSKQRFWVGTENGLNLFDHKTDRFVRFHHDPTDPRSLADDDVMSINEDRSGNLWVGTRAGGVSKWNPRSWLLGHFGTHWLDSPQVTSFATDGDTSVWIGTMGGGLTRVNLEDGDFRTYRQTLTPASTGLSDDRVMSLLRDSEGVLWIGTMTGGLNRLDPSTDTITTFRHEPSNKVSLGADGVVTIFEDLHGVIWVGTYGGGLNRFDRSSGTFTRFEAQADEPGRLSGSIVTAIAQDINGTMWIGTDGGGLNRFNAADGVFDSYRHDPHDPSSISSDAIFSLHVADGVELWIGTAGQGLDRLIGSGENSAKAKFENVEIVREQLGRSIYGVRADASGALWLSTNNGLGRYDHSSSSLKVLRRSHGLQGDEFNFGAHHRAASGRLFFGGPNGFNAFFPAAIEQDDSAVPVVLSDLQISNQPVKADSPYHQLESIELDPQSDSITLEFAALEFTSPTHNQYAYRLGNRDSDWVELGTSRRVTFANLDPGAYDLQVKASNSDGVWSDIGLSLPITVNPPLWATTPAYLLYGVLSLSLILLVRQLHRRELNRKIEYSRQLERQVSEHTDQLEERNRRLEELSRAKSEFLAHMSHEIRTPMNGVLGMTDLLLKTRMQGEQREYAETIHSSAETLLRIINDILDVSKIEAGKLDIEKVEFGIQSLVDDTVALLARSAEEKSLELSCVMSIDRRVRVMGDPHRLRQVLINLIGNAIKFTEEGSVVLYCTEDGATVDSVTYRFEVRDTGIGIRPDKQDRIFDVFTQEDVSTTRRFGGTGLGLAISKQLVELMRGQIGVESEPGVGSSFWFTVRLDRAIGDTPAASQDRVADEALTGRSVVRNSGGETELPRLVGRVLLVEDMPVNQKVTTAMLRELGCSVEVVDNGAAATRRVLETTFDVVLMDCHMPGMDGFEATATIREHEGVGTRVPIVALTANASDTDRERCLAADMDDYLAKPFTLSELHEKLACWLPTNNVAATPTSTQTDDDVLAINRRPLDDLRSLSGPDGSEILAEAVELYLLDSAKLMADLDSAVSALDLVTVRETAHALGSASASLGADEIGKICRNLERWARSGSLDNAATLYARLTRIYPQFVKALRIEVTKRSA